MFSNAISGGFGTSQSLNGAGVLFPLGNQAGHLVNFVQPTTAYNTNSGMGSFSSSINPVGFGDFGMSSMGNPATFMNSGLNSMPQGSFYNGGFGSNMQSFPGNGLCMNQDCFGMQNQVGSSNPFGSSNMNPMGFDSTMPSQFGSSNPFGVNNMNPMGLGGSMPSQFGSNNPFGGSNMNPMGFGGSMPSQFGSNNPFGVNNMNPMGFGGSMPSQFGSNNPFWGNNMNFSGMDSSMQNPANVRYTDNDTETVIEFSLPGITPENATLSIVGREMRIRPFGGSRGNKNMGDNSYYSLPIPGYGDISSIQFSATDDLLRITIPTQKEIANTIKTIKPVRIK